MTLGYVCPCHTNSINVLQKTEFGERKLKKKKECQTSCLLQNLIPNTSLYNEQFLKTHNLLIRSLLTQKQPYSDNLIELR